MSQLVFVFDIGKNLVKKNLVFNIRYGFDVLFFMYFPCHNHLDSYRKCNYFHVYTLKRRYYNGCIENIAASKSLKTMFLFIYFFLSKI